MDADKASKIYDAHYYATGCGRPYQRDEQWLNFFGEIAGRIASAIQPATVLDAGCAWGFLVEALRHKGIEAYGVDVSEYAIQQVHPDIRPYCWQGSATEPFPQKYDLIISIEVLEHMLQTEAEIAVENLCQYSDDILFSSTPFDYKEATHFNVQPPEYWAELFARQGFFRDVDFDASFITPWAVRFRHKNEPLPRMAREYERKFFLLWKENADLHSLAVEMRDEISSLNAQLASDKERLVDLDRAASLANLQLGEIRESRSWQWIQRLQKIRRGLIPLGSTRERLFLKLLGKK